MVSTRSTGAVFGLALRAGSVAGVACGSILAVAALTAESIVAWVALPAAAVVAQSLYTILWLRLRPVRAHPVGDRLFVGGQVAALVLAAIGLGIGAVRQWGSADPEFGPPTIMVLVGLHAVVGLAVHRLTTTG